jgi:hypothetical protein
MRSEQKLDGSALLRRVDLVEALASNCYDSAAWVTQFPQNGCRGHCQHSVASRKELANRIKSKWSGHQLRPLSSPPSDRREFAREPPEWPQLILPHQVGSRNRFSPPDTGFSRARGSLAGSVRNCECFQRSLAAKWQAMVKNRPFCAAPRSIGCGRVAAAVRPFVQ